MKLLSAILAFSIPLSLIAAHGAINPSDYYQCMQARRHALGLTLEQHYNSGLWLSDDQRCSQ